MKGWMALGLLVTMGCHSEPVAADSTGGVAGGGGDAATSEGAGGDAASSGAVWLEPADGWVDGASNSLGIQGAMFAAGDVFSYGTLVSDFRGSRACMSGAAVQVDLTCQAPPGGDCFGLHYGAFIGLNLNQPRAGTDAGEPQPFDISAITGFAFDVEGPLVPSLVRFELETDQTDQDALYCEPTLSGEPASGHREVRIEELTQRCYAGGRRGEAATTVKERALRLRWHVVTNDTGDVPFDFCVTNVQALTD
jgi:hypothetical protein